MGGLQAAREGGFLGEMQRIAFRLMLSSCVVCVCVIVIIIIIQIYIAPPTPPLTGGA